MKFFPSLGATIIFLINIPILSAVIGQNIQGEIQQETFLDARIDDFNKLTGGIQEGGRLNYNSNNASIELSGGKEIKSKHLFVQGVGSIGTTTNLTSLFNQNALPTFSGSIIVHKLLTGNSTWYYDGTFSRNYSELKDSSVNVEDINTQVEKEAIVFEYRSNLKEKVLKGTIKTSDKLYTFKRFQWLSFSTNYSYSEYLFYDDSRAFSEQFYKPIYNSWTGKVAFNTYLFWNKTDVKWKRKFWGFLPPNIRPHFFYFNLAIQYGLGNNIQQLDKATVNDIISTSSSGNLTRQILESKSAYNGTFKEFRTFTPSLELILSPVKLLAINIFGDLNLINKSERTENNIDNFGSIATGIYFYGDGINLGAFHKWTRNNSTNSWMEMIELRTSIPITPLD